MRLLKATSATLALIAAYPALAQDAQVEASASTAEQRDPVVADGDIVVTARRRAEGIRDIPGTISAVTADQLEAKGAIASTGDLLSTVPGVRFNDLSSENLSEVSIRGSGTQRATGADSGVGLFVNGAYVGSSTLGGRNFKTLDYFDVERVEVLEGPQGALYGRNSEFGVVNIVLAKPKFADSGYIRNTFTFGLNQNRLSAVVNKKVSDTVAVRIGGEVYGQTKGFYYNPTADKYYDSTNGWNGRAQLRYQTGNLDVNLLVDAQDLRLPTFANRYLLPAGVNAQIPLGFTQDRFVIPHDGKDGMQQKVLRAMLTASLDLGNGLSLQSTTMATKWRSEQAYAAAIDLASVVEMRKQGQIGIYPFGQVETDVKDRTLYQDLHLKGTAAGGKLNWIVGVEGLYQSDEYQITSATTPCPMTLASSICTGTPTAPVCIKPLPTSNNCPTVFPNNFGTDSRTKQSVYSVAAYASLQYTLGNFTVQGEGRVSHDQKDVTQGVYALYTTNYTRTPTSYTFKGDQPAFTATVSYKIPGPSRTLVYAKVGTGYRAGGVNNGSYNAAATNPYVFTYGNERTVGYEAGVKSNLTRNVFLRLSGYLSRTKDGITSITDGCTVVNACGTAGQIFNVNGGTIHAKGLEAALDGRFKLAGGQLAVNLSAATQSARFAEIPKGVSGLPILDSSVAQIPEWTFSVGADYRRPIAEGVVGFVSVNYAGQRGGIQDTVTAAASAIPLSDFDVLNTRVGVNIGNIQAAVFVRNVTDQEIQVLKFRSGEYPLSARYNKPRTVGLNLSYRW